MSAHEGFFCPNMLFISVFLQKQFTQLIGDFGAAHGARRLDPPMEAFRNVDGEPFRRLPLTDPVVGGRRQRLIGRLGSNGDFLGHRQTS